PESGGDTAAGVFESDEMSAKVQALGADARLHRVHQHNLQVAAMDGELRPLIAGELAERLAIDELAEAMEEGRILRLDGNLRQRRNEAERVEDAIGVRQDVDPHADRLDLRSGLENPARDATPGELHRQSEAADTGADDQDVVQVPSLRPGTPSPARRWRRFR